MRKIQLVLSSQMEEMRKIFYEYLTELSQFDPKIKFDKGGKPIYKWFDCYWEDEDRFPYYFLVDEKIAGLALIRKLASMQYEIAEFYVRPEYRKDGNALWFAEQITNHFDGQFVFSTRLTNARAVKFWTKFTSQFESSSFADDSTCRNWTILKK